MFDNLILEKQNINENYNQKILSERFNFQLFENIYKQINQNLKLDKKEKFLEISHYFTPTFQYFSKDFNQGYFLSDNSYQSLLVYHIAEKENQNINVLNYNFNFKHLYSQDYYENFDLIYSIMGMSFQEFYELIPHLIEFLKMDGKLILVYPTYWMSQENLSDIEKVILNYSKQNDKKWIFIEPLETILTKNGAHIIENKTSNLPFKINRIELAYLSSLTKLYNAEIAQNTAHLEVCNIPQKDITLNTNILTIEKTEKTITKYNLFNF
jgi:hypothetical protein